MTRTSGLELVEKTEKTTLYAVLVHFRTVVFAACFRSRRIKGYFTDIEIESQLNWTHATDMRRVTSQCKIFPVRSIQVSHFVTSAPFN